MTPELTVSDYFDALPPHRAERLRMLERRILKKVPAARVSMRYKMPTFEVGDAWMSIGNQKRYVSVYTCSHEHIEPYLKAHPRTKAGTGCLNFTDRAEIDETALDAVIVHALGAVNHGSGHPVHHPKKPAKKRSKS